MKKHSLLWWILVGWWYYLYIWWWLTPIKFLVKKLIERYKDKPLNSDIGNIKSKNSNANYYKRDTSNRKNNYNYTDRKLKNYIVIDTETTGLSHYSNEIIEIAAIRIVNGKIVDKFQTLVKPHNVISPSITKITGITNDMVKNSPDILDVLPDFFKFIGNTPLVGHNITFDLRFLNSYLEDNLTNSLADTMLIARKKLPNLDNHKLETIVRLLNITDHQDHRALSDCNITYKVYERL
jgi:DNA polymerase-3 subunit epsilon